MLQMGQQIKTRHVKQSLSERAKNADSAISWARERGINKGVLKGLMQGL